MITPAPLEKGNKVAIVAPGKSIDEHAVDAALDIFESWGLEVVLGRYLFSSHDQFAGKDKHRAKDLQNVIDDSSIKAIFCVRGGYGTTRIIDDINFTALRSHPKWIIGFSDITALLSHLYNLGYESIHGIMPALFGKKGTKKAISSLKDLLFGKIPNYVVSPHKLNNIGEGKGNLVGGNLAILCHLIGSSSDIITDDTILFLEDVGEPLYNLDRMMIQLKRSGKLERLAGMVVGQFTETKDEGDVPFGKNAMEIIQQHVANFDFPVCFGFQAGHVALNLALPIGRKCILSVDKFGAELSFKPPKTMI